jgi:hypothetical protein
MSEVKELKRRKQISILGEVSREKNGKMLERNVETTKESK